MNCNCDINILATGGTICWLFQTVFPKDTTDVEVVFTLPDGAVFNSFGTPSTGSFDTPTLTWSIGVVPAEEIIALQVCATITDIAVFSAGNGEWSANVTASGCGTTPIDKTFTECVGGLTCEDINACVVGPAVIEDGQNTVVSGTGTVLDPYMIDGCCVSYNSIDNTITITDENGTVTGPVPLDSGTISVVTDSNTNPNVHRIAIHDDGDGNTVDINESVSTLENNGDGTFTYTDELEGVTTIDLCNNLCPPIAVIAIDNVFNANECGSFYGNLANDDTECSKGLTVWKLVDGTANNIESVVVGANGEFLAIPIDCSMPMSFVYQAECTDGTISSAVVTINFPPLTGALAVDDNYAGTNKSPVPFNLSVNDTLCTPPNVTSFVVSDLTGTNGTVVLATNGTGFFVPFGGFTGSTSFEYDILCNGVIESTATATIIVVDASVNDDFEVGLFETVTGPYDATANDNPCGPPAITTYDWEASFGSGALALGGFGGTFVGVPSNFTYSPQAGFCGSDYVKYQQFCDIGGGPILFSEGTIFIYVSCGAPVGDNFVSNNLDTAYTDNVANNDFLCSFGAVTTFHLVSDLTANGGGLTEPTTDPDVIITDWDQATGNVTFLPSNGFIGTVTADYILRCTSPDGSSHDFGPSTISFEVAPPMPISKIVVNNSILGDTGTAEVCLSGRLFLNGSNLPLDTNDILHIVIPEIGLNVELLVNGDPLLVTGYQNDTGATTWASLIPYLITTNTFTAANLLTGNYCLTFDKFTWAFDTGNIGQNNGIELTWNNTVIDISTTLSDITSDVMVRVAKVTSDNTMAESMDNIPIIGAIDQGVTGVYPDAFALERFGVGGCEWVTDNNIVLPIGESNCNFGVRQFFVTSTHCLTGQQVRIVEHKYYDQPAVIANQPAITWLSDDRISLTDAVNALPSVHPIVFASSGYAHGTWFLPEAGIPTGAYCLTGVPTYFGGPYGYYKTYWASNTFELPLVENVLEYAVFEVQTGTCTGYFKFSWDWTLEF